METDFVEARLTLALALLSFSQEEDGEEDEEEEWEMSVTCQFVSSREHSARARVSVRVSVRVRGGTSLSREEEEKLYTFGAWRRSCVSSHEILHAFFCFNLYVDVYNQRSTVYYWLLLAQLRPMQCCVCATTHRRL